MNFTGKVVLTSSVIYTKMFVCMYGFRIQLITTSLMSTYRVTAVESYIPFIKDYEHFAYSWQISLHLFMINTLNWNIFMIYMVLD